MKKILIYLFILAFSISFCGAVVEAQTPEQQAAARAYMKKKKTTTATAANKTQILGREQLEPRNGVFYDTRTNKPATGLVKDNFKGNFIEMPLKNGKVDGVLKQGKDHDSRVEYTFKNSRLTGLSKNYENGRLELEIIYKDAKAVSGYRYQNGQKTKLSDKELLQLSTTGKSLQSSVTNVGS